jgi:hypothetical protein
LGRTRKSGLARPKNEVRFMNYISYCCGFLIQLFVWLKLFLYWFVLWMGKGWQLNEFQVKIERSIYVCCWILHVLHICSDFLGDKAFRFWGVHESSCCYCHSHCAVLHIKVLWFRFFCGSVIFNWGLGSFY